MNNSFKKLGTVLLISIVFIAPISVFSQQFFRIKSEYSIKYKDSKGNQILQMGVVFYDINSGTIVMKNGFPVREVLVQRDTVLYQVRNDKLVSTSRAYALVDLSVFHMALTGELNNYGLDKAGYQLENVKSDKGLILTTWLPPDNAKKYLGKILVSTKEKRLFGIIFLNPREKIIAKHFYRDYTNIDGFIFPAEVLRITYFNGEESYKLTKYSKIKVNGTDDEQYYNYKIPGNKN